jgi:hypothetical protein
MKTYPRVWVYLQRNFINIGFEVLAAVTMKNAVFWVETPFSSKRSRRFGGHIASIIRVDD